MNSVNTEDKTYMCSANEAQIKRNKVRLELRKKRQRILFKRKLMASLTAIIMIAAIITVINTVTAQGNKVEKQKYYKSVMVEAGDTLWDIAKEYYDSSSYTIQEYVEELKSINSLTCDNIQSGNYIVVSYYLK